MIKAQVFFRSLNTKCLNNLILKQNNIQNLARKNYSPFVVNSSINSSSILIHSFVNNFSTIKNKKQDKSTTKSSRLILHKSKFFLISKNKSFVK